MNREYLVLIESEVERRDAWITKNEAKMAAPPAEDVQDLEGFLQVKDAHDVCYIYHAFCYCVVSKAPSHLLSDVILSA